MEIIKDNFELKNFGLNYDESILSVAASVLNHYGAEDCKHKTLKELDELLCKNYKNVIVMLFDGMGVSAINQHLNENDLLRKHLVKSISSVFPSTTTAATTSIQSGYSPAEHGWIGWDLYFEEIDKNVSIFSNTLQDEDTPAADFHVAGKYLPFKNIFTRIEETDDSVEAVYVSPFSKHKIKSLNDISDAVIKLARKNGRHFIYTYYNQPDSFMHKFGVSSKEVKTEITEINALVENLADKLKDTLIVVTADHGQTDGDIVYLEDDPVLANLLTRPPSVEPRALSFFVKDGKPSEFKSEFNRLFGDDFILLTKEETLNSGIFGAGAQNRKLNSFIGDFFAVATGRKTILNSRKSGFYVGVHAGLTKEEMTVPFIAVET